MSLISPPQQRSNGVPAAALPDFQCLLRCAAQAVATLPRRPPNIVANGKIDVCGPAKAREKHSGAVGDVWHAGKQAGAVKRGKADNSPNWALPLSMYGTAGGEAAVPFPSSTCAGLNTKKGSKNFSAQTSHILPAVFPVDMPTGAEAQNSCGHCWLLFLFFRPLNPHFIPRLAAQYWHWFEDCQWAQGLKLEGF